MLPRTAVNSIIFVVRPEPATIRQVLYQWRQMNGPALDREIYMLFVPRRTIECDEMLFQEGMFSEGTQNISQINMDLIPLDDDLLSLE